MPDSPLRPPDAAYAPADDPIVTEVRAIREAMSAEVGHDLRRLYERFREREDAERAAGREVLPPPAHAARG